MDSDISVGDEWVSPCKCSGTSKWVHQNCIKKWLAYDDTPGSVSCPQCLTPYVIIQPPSSMFLKVATIIDTAAEAFSPVGTGLFVVSMGWAGLGAYSLYTIPRVFGQDVMDSLFKMHPLKLYLLLPIFPITLWISRLKVRARITTRRNPVQRANPANEDQEEVRRELELSDVLGHRTMPRVVFGALLLPFVSCTVGNFLLVGQSFHRAEKTLIGWLLYSTVKEILEAFHHRQRVSRHAALAVANYHSS